MQRTRNAVFTVGRTGPRSLLATAPTQLGIIPNPGGLPIRLTHGYAPMADVEEFDSVIAMHCVAPDMVNLAGARCPALGGA
jgi:hypothetical protein